MHHCDRLLYAGDEGNPGCSTDLVDNVYIELPYACEESGDLSQPLASGKLTKDRVKLMHEYLVSGKKRSKKVRQHISNRLEWDYLMCVSHRNYMK